MIRSRAMVSKAGFCCIFYFLVCFMISGCNGRNGKSFLPDIPGYDSKSKEVYVLHKQLLEISGISFINETALAAINDEDGKVFTVNFEKGKPPSFEFGGNHDYEDIVYTDSMYYVLESSGDMYCVPAADPSATRTVRFHRRRKIEFESLYTDPRTHKLVLLSKEQRLIDEAIIAYEFDPNTKQFSDQPLYVIPLKEVKKLMKDYSAECKPSGAAVHPILNKLFVIASVGKVLFICSLDGKVESAYELNPDLFAQPEGICFSPYGDMFISNEGLQGKATVIRFRYDPPRN
ncbi:MAG: hypothetical protein EOO02_13885 [Chitinophagaceae bacterium]|nr:MAG: hypothetical protein EOO02_13885 [Chitinophagaceae bacterium]